MKEHNCFFDTNIFLRIVAKDDPVKLRDCQKLIVKVRRREIQALTSSLVMAELAWTAGRFYGFNKSEVVEILGSASGITNLGFTNESNMAAALELFSQHSVKLVDCLIASHPEIVAGRMVVVSYDRDFDRLGVKRLEPADLL